jgi:hypothetical protein
MISIYRSMTSEPEGAGFAVYTTAVSGHRVRIGDFATARLAQQFIARRTKHSRYCPIHAWTFINPDRPTICPGDHALTDTPWINTSHEVIA